MRDLDRGRHGQRKPRRRSRRSKGQGSGSLNSPAGYNFNWSVTPLEDGTENVSEFQRQGVATEPDANCGIACG
jgi:hypothetical protein